MRATWDLVRICLRCVIILLTNNPSNDDSSSELREHQRGESDRKPTEVWPWDTGSRHCWMLCFTVFCIPSSQSDRLSIGSTALALLSTHTHNRHWHTSKTAGLSFNTYIISSTSFCHSNYSLRLWCCWSGNMMVIQHGVTLENRTG